MYKCMNDEYESVCVSERVCLQGRAYWWMNELVFSMNWEVYRKACRPYK